MATTTVGPGEFLKAEAAAKTGDTLVVHGPQPLAGSPPQYDMRKVLHLVNGKGQRASLNGRVVTHPEADGASITDEAGPGDPRTAGLIFDISGHSYPGGASAITLANANVHIDTLEGHGDGGLHSNIGMNLLEDATWGKADLATIANLYLHDYGDPHKASPDNHIQGLYISSRKVTIAHFWIDRCEARGFQNRGDEFLVAINGLISRCGEGAIFGETDVGPSDNNWMRKMIVIDNVILDRTLIETWMDGPNNGFEGFCWRADGKPVYHSLDGTPLDTSGIIVKDPKFNYATGRLAADSPALGYGPSWIQPSVAPPPPPPPPPPASAAARALLSLAGSSLNFKQWASGYAAEHGAVKAYIGGGNRPSAGITTKYGNGMLLVGDELRAHGETITLP